MEGRGKRSAAALSVVQPVAVVRRAEPPAGLNQRERDVFVSVVDAMPADWFSAPTIPLLVEYARAVCMSDLLNAQVQAAMEEGEIVQIEKLLRLRDTECKRVSSLATKMRLSQQSSYNTMAADTAKRRSGGASAKPWALPEE